MANSPLLYGPNSKAINLQEGAIQPSGAYNRYDGNKNYIGNSTFENGLTTGWTAISGPPGSLVGNTTVALTSGRYYFNVTSANATVGATYTNNAQTFTVVTTIAAGTILVCTGTGTPSGVSGTLTKSTGSGDATIAFSNYNLSNPAGTFTLSTISTGQLTGTYSLSMASSGVQYDGMISDAITIDIADQAKVLSGSFYYNVNTGANFNASGTSANSLAVYIYDVTAAAWIQPAGIYNIVQKTGTGICTFTFQTTASSTQYQIYVYNVAATSGGYTVYADNFYLGPQTVAQAPAMSDWVAYTPTLTGASSYSTILAYSRRVGDTLQCEGRAAFVTPSAAAVTISLGYNGASGNVTADTTKSASGSVLGSAWTDNASATIFSWAILNTGGTSVTVGIQTSTVTAANTATAATVVLGAGTRTLYWYFEVPIVGWSSNAVSSADTDTRVISFTGTQTSQAVTANVTDVAYTTIVDRAGAWNGTQYIVPVAGDYVFTACALVSASGTLVTYKNAVAAGVLGAQNTATLNATGTFLHIGCKAGDILSVRCTTSITLTSGSISVFRLSGPAVVQATESVGASYTGAPPTGTLAAAFNTTTYATKVNDSHNAYSAGTYTVPVSGRYSISAGVAINATFAVSKIADLAIFVNGTVRQEGLQEAGGAQASLFPNVNCHSLALNAGDLVTIRAYCDATGPTYGSVATTNYFQIVRTGN